MHPSSQDRRAAINPASATVPIEANTKGRRYTSAEAFWPTSHIHNETEVVIVRVFKISKHITE